MSGIRSRNTRPEIRLRKGLSSLGVRYRLHRKDLPGTPDLAFMRQRAAVFVNGCFWHAHDCHLFKVPATRPAFWAEKFARNRDRDAATLDRLEKLGWRTLVIWECAFRGRGSLGDDVIAQKTAHWVEHGTGSCELRGT